LAVRIKLAAIKSSSFLHAKWISAISFSETAGSVIFSPGIKIPFLSHKTALLLTLTLIQSEPLSIQTVSINPSSIKTRPPNFTVIGKSK
jgi:hypothetical protein